MKTKEQIVGNLRRIAEEVRRLAEDLQGQPTARVDVVDDLYANADELARLALRVEHGPYLTLVVDGVPVPAAKIETARSRPHPTSCTCNQCERGHDL